MFEGLVEETIASVSVALGARNVYWRGGSSGHGKAPGWYNTAKSKAEAVSIWHPGQHDNPFGQRLTCLMIAKGIADRFDVATEWDGDVLFFQRSGVNGRIVVDPDQILVSCGGKQSFFNLAQAILDPGDEVVIPAPYWVSYPDIALLASGAPVLVHAGAEQRFKISPAQLNAAMTDQTKLVVINSPSNPTGMAYTADELAALGDVLREYPRAVIATDDMYEHIRWSSDPFVNILNVCPDLASRTLVLNGVSKAYSMTGWRIGYAGGPAEVIKAMKKVQGQSTSNPTSISQVAAQAALSGPQDCIAPMLAAFKERHDFVVEALNRIPGIECLATDGTFYVFPRVQGLIDRLDGINNDLELAEYLIETSLQGESAIAARCAATVTAGVDRVTTKNLQVVRIDEERGLLFIRGAVPGPNDGFVQVQSARTPRRSVAAKSAAAKG